MLYESRDLVSPPCYNIDQHCSKHVVFHKCLITTEMNEAKNGFKLIGKKRCQGGAQQTARSPAAWFPQYNSGDTGIQLEVTESLQLFLL